MARIEELKDNETLTGLLSKSLQSGRINFLLGSGASLPAIPVGGDVEREVEELFQAGRSDEANLALYNCLATICEPVNALIAGTSTGRVAETLSNYESFVSTVENILNERRTTLIPRQATLFTTNYDLFVEQACASCLSLNLIDGFQRSPRLDGRAAYSSRAYFNSIFNVGRVYRYQVELPCLNLVKLHGSLSWLRDGDGITLSVKQRTLLAAGAGAAERQAFISQLALVLPHASKYGLTVLEQTYYELLRLFANELERENSLLVSFGFSFRDQHILSILKRALQNPTLLLFAFAFDEPSIASYSATFARENNVVIVAPKSGETIGMNEFVTALKKCVPDREAT